METQFASEIKAAFTYAVVFLSAITAFGLFVDTGLIKGDKRDELARWLKGERENNWSYHFISFFDSIFGEKHLRPRCFSISALLSVASVVFLYIMFADALGDEQQRIQDGMPLMQALLLGAFINIIPDYVSLLQTRWVLKLMSRFRSSIAQIVMIVIDVLATGAIIILAINGFQTLMGERLVSVAEMVGVFSIYSIFFYSTFATSIWSWVFALGGVFVRYVAKSSVMSWVNVEGKPVTQISAFAGAVAFVPIVMVNLLVFSPVGDTRELKSLSFVDRALCGIADEICPQLISLTEDPEEVKRVIEMYCGDRPEFSACFQDLRKFYEARGGDAEAARTMHDACEKGFMRACSGIGFMYLAGYGLERDATRAAEFYRLACRSGDPWGCSDLGTLYSKGNGVERDKVAAVNLYRQACELGDWRGCTNLGYMYDHGNGVEQDEARAVEIYKQACENEDATGCSNLARMYLKGLGVNESIARAIELFWRACSFDGANGCYGLGLAHLEGRGVDQNNRMALIYLEKACDLRSPKGCFKMARLYLAGQHVEKDIAKGRSLIKRACEVGHSASCLLASVSRE